MLSSSFLISFQDELSSSARSVGAAVGPAGSWGWGSPGGVICESLCSSFCRSEGIASSERINDRRASMEGVKSPLLCRPCDHVKPQPQTRLFLLHSRIVAPQWQRGGGGDVPTMSRSRGSVTRVILRNKRDDQQEPEKSKMCIGQFVIQELLLSIFVLSTGSWMLVSCLSLPWDLLSAE